MRSDTSTLIFDMAKTEALVKLDYSIAHKPVPRYSSYNYHITLYFRGAKFPWTAQLTCFLDFNFMSCARELPKNLWDKISELTQNREKAKTKRLENKVLYDTC